MVLKVRCGSDLGKSEESDDEEKGILIVQRN